MAVDFDSLAALLASRRSIRRFAPDPIPDSVVEGLLLTACRAPSAHNRQPWRFVVVRQGERRARLVEAMARRFRADLEADRLAEDEIERRVRTSRERLLAAPVAIIVCVSMAEMDRYPDARRQAAERAMAIQSVALAGGHLLLAAHAAGLGACWLCAPLFVPEVVRETLDLPPDWEAQGLILVGKPAEPGLDRGRKPLSQVMAWR
ncbi:MAG: nitroreductase family protein [Chloroflexota bacterium]